MPKLLISRQSTKKILKYFSVTTSSIFQFSLSFSNMPINFLKAILSQKSQDSHSRRGEGRRPVGRCPSPRWEYLCFSLRLIAEVQDACGGIDHNGLVAVHLLGEDVF